MAYSAKAIANEFLRLAERDGKHITAMKLQKLVYFAHGWSLALRDHALIVDSVEAWRWGPVIPEIYHHFKGYGNHPIGRRATKEKKINGENRIVTPVISGSDNDTKRLIERIWNLYGKYSAIQLSNMTHEKGTPWESVWSNMPDKSKRGVDIPDEQIGRYFKTQFAY